MCEEKVPDNWASCDSSNDLLAMTYKGVNNWSCKSYKASWASPVDEAWSLPIIQRQGEIINPKMPDIKTRGKNTVIIVNNRAEGAKFFGARKNWVNFENLTKTLP